MLGQVRPDAVAVSLRLLAYLTLIVADSKASSIPQSIGARGMGITSPDESLFTIKNIVEWVFAAAFVIVVCSVFIWRVKFLRARDRPLRDFFTFIEAPKQRGGPSLRLMRPNPRTRNSGFALRPLDRQRRGRTRAADTDFEGRRAHGSDSGDTNGNVTGGDVLPSYEVKGGPPNYSQFLIVDPGTGADARSQITEAMPVGTSPRPQLAETGSGIADPSNQPSTTLDVQLPHPPPPSYSPGTATTRPITPH
ncbi:hypothetical protein BDM02DRAFT_3024539 [Thelephora ganbajun]|uniref:Uncharacterized protein n=1 Tax=Thelephora ganbajun TaxID=370292 RepID=A0ACB6ZA21_THEGA|nr:hypothetical protein BDM02DRAFT_3024539 [Thelephora ganbajun]